MSELRPDERRVLQDEVAKGTKAERAYADFIQPFVRHKQQTLYDAFLATDPSKVEQLVEIRRMTIALDALDKEISDYILSGQMAKKQLTDDEK